MCECYVKQWVPNMIVKPNPRCECGSEGGGLSEEGRGASRARVCVCVCVSIALFVIHLTSVEA